MHDLCHECPSGQFQSETGQTTCELCSSGQFQGQTGQTGCSQCAAGQFSTEGWFSCVDCAPGWVSSAGSSSCTECEVGRYSNAVLDGCVDCSEAWTSAAGASACYRDGQYTRQLGYANAMAVVGQSNFHSPAKCRKAVQNNFGGDTTATQVISSTTVASGCTGYSTGSAWEPHLNTYNSGRACGTNSAGSYTGSGRYLCVIPGDYSVGGTAVDGWGCVGATYDGTPFCSNLPGWTENDYNPNSYKCCVANECVGGWSLGCTPKCAEGWFHHSVSGDIFNPTAEICMGRNANGFLYN